MSQTDDRDEIPEILPLIPLRDLTLFPNLVVPLFVGRERSIEALEEAMRKGHVVALVTQREAETQDPGHEDMYEIGCVAAIMQELKLPDGTAKALVEGIQRFRVVEFVQTDPYFLARVELIEEAENTDTEIEARMRALVQDFEKAAGLGKPIPQEVVVAAGGIDEPGRLADFVTFHLHLRVEDKQQILDALSPKDRLDKTQREYFLREQLKAIQQELGQADEQQVEIDEYEEKIEQSGMPEEVEEKARKELGRLAKMPAAAAETSVIRTYLDWLIGLPWQAQDEEHLDLESAQDVLDEDHYGLEKVKEQARRPSAARSPDP